ncbi:fluoroquinolone resistance protein [Mucilaginibacter sp. UYNi724]
MFTQPHYDDKAFDKMVLTGAVVNHKEFQSCTFRNCDFSNSNFGRNKFLDCTFEECNLSMMQFDSSTLNDIAFKGCKIMGVNFSKSEDFLFGVGFDNCILDYASFAGKKMVKTKFKRSSLKEVSFTQTNLNGSVFDECDLLETVFNRSDLSAVNFATSYNIILDPELNNLKKAVFAMAGLEGLLTKYGIKVV